jgi:hypothetical protein
MAAQWLLRPWKSTALMRRLNIGFPLVTEPEINLTDTNPLLNVAARFGSATRTEKTAKGDKH